MRPGGGTELRAPRVTPAWTAARTLRQVRVNGGWTQGSLAQVLDVQQSMVSEWEGGGLDLRAATLVRWAAALGACVVIEVPGPRATHRVELRDGHTTVERVAAALRDARLRRTWTQYTLARRMHVRQSMVSALERGALNLQVSTLVRWVTALDGRLLIEPPAEGACPPGLRLDRRGGPRLRP